MYFVLPMYAWILTEPKRMTNLETTSSFGDELETAVSVLAKHALKAFQKNLVIHPLHAAAIIPHPRLRSVHTLTPFGKREVDRCKRLESELISGCHASKRCCGDRKEGTVAQHKNCINRLQFF
jgi:hypothetical protein